MAKRYFRFFLLIESGCVLFFGFNTPIYICSKHLFLSYQLVKVNLEHWKYLQSEGTIVIELQEQNLKTKFRLKNHLLWAVLKGIALLLYKEKAQWCHTASLSRALTKEWPLLLGAAFHRWFPIVGLEVNPSDVLRA